MILPLIIFLFLLITRLAPYLNNKVFLGYDPGLYIYLFKEYAQLPYLDFLKLPDWIIYTFQPGIALVGKLLMSFFRPEDIILPMIITFQILLAIALYLFVNKIWGKKIAIWTLFIFATSAIQFRLYWFYYLKNIAALSFLLFAFYFLQTSSYWAIPLVILVSYFHQQTAFFLFLVLILLLISQKKKRKYLTVVLISSIAASFPYYLITFNQSLMPLVQPAIDSFIPKSLGGKLGEGSGTFYNSLQAFVLSIPYLFLGLYGAWQKRKDKNSLIILIPFFLSAIIVIFGLFFSRRLIPYADLFLIILAGYGADKFFKGKNLLKAAYISILVIFSLFFVAQTGKPLIIEDELREIKMLSETESNASILVTDEAYTSWVYGWSDRKVIAPGYGENDIYWTIPQWHQFWESGSTELQKTLLLKLPKPLYIYHGDRGRQVRLDFSGECFEKTNWRTYKFVCD